MTKETRWKPDDDDEEPIKTAGSLLAGMPQSVKPGNPAFGTNILVGGLGVGVIRPTGIGSRNTFSSVSGIIHGISCEGERRNGHERVN